MGFVAVRELMWSSPHCLNTMTASATCLQHNLKEFYKDDLQFIFPMKSVTIIIQYSISGLRDLTLVPCFTDIACVISWLSAEW